MIVREKVIVLKSYTFSESDLIIRALNQKGTQLSLIAKGALKSKKRFVGGVLEPSSYIELDYKKTKSSLYPIQQAWILEDFRKLRSEWTRLNLALSFLNIMEKISQEGENDSNELFHLLGNSLKQAEISSDLETLKILFQAKVLFLQGVLAKEISQLNILQKTLEKHEEIHFNPEEKQYYLNHLERQLNNYLS